MEEMELLYRQYDAFQNVSKDTISILNIYGIIRNAPKKTVIFQEREESDFVYFIMDGVVSVYKCSESGKNKAIFMLHQGDFLNEDDHNNICSTVNAIAFEDATLLCIPRDIFYKLLHSDPKLMEVVYASLSKKLRRTYRQLKNLSSHVNVDKRVASKLYRLAKDYGIESAKGTFINVDMTVTYLSDLLGVQRESCSRALKVLIDKDLVLFENKHFYIPDMKNLANYFKL